MCLESSYELITATRFDPLLSTLSWNNDQDGPSCFLLLQYHLDRLLRAVDLHGWDNAKSSLTYDRLKSVCQTTLTTHDNQEVVSRALKVRSRTARWCPLTRNLCSSDPPCLIESWNFDSKCFARSPFHIRPYSRISF